MNAILATLAFYASNPGWQSFKRNDRTTRNAVKRLARRGFLRVNEFSQAEFTGKVFEDKPQATT